MSPENYKIIFSRGSNDFNNVFDTTYNEYIEALLQAAKSFNMPSEVLAKKDDDCCRENKIKPRRFCNLDCTSL